VPAGPHSGCDGYAAVPKFNPPDQVMADTLSVNTFAPVKVGVDGDIDWTLDPYHHPSWLLWFHTLRWTGSLIESYQATGNTAHLDRAVKIIKDWVADNPNPALWTANMKEARAHRTGVLLCLLDVIGPQQWLVDTLNVHAGYLEQNYSGAWNHGLDENLALFGVGCDLQRQDYIDFAMRRVAAMAPEVVDAQGVANEQSIAYQESNYLRYLVMRERLAGCGYAMPAVLDQRVNRMPEFLAHATQPDGKYVQIGDTYDLKGVRVNGTPMEYTATLGTSGTPPKDRVRIYQAGYVFGRTRWSPMSNSAYYTLRFGPGARLHGHNDHMQLTWYAQGRRLLVDSGHVGYYPDTDPYRAYVRSPEAHNVLTVSGVTLQRTAATALQKARLTSRFDYFRTHDKAYGGRDRYRDVLILRNPDVAVVLDRVTSKDSRVFTQNWHLAQDFRVKVANSRTAVATSADGRSRFYLVQVPFPGQVIPIRSTKAVTGQVKPKVQGVLGTHPATKVPAPVVTMSRSGKGTRMLTVLVPTKANSSSVRTALAREGAGWRLTLTVGATVKVVHITRDWQLFA
jgi:hypothetical protein